MCEAKSEGLVRYPTTLAPVSGSVTVTTQCADNANTTDSNTLKVTCDSHGNWSGVVPNCYCIEGYHEVTVNGSRYAKVSNSPWKYISDSNC